MCRYDVYEAAVVSRHGALDLLDQSRPCAALCRREPRCSLARHRPTGRHHGACCSTHRHRAGRCGVPRAGTRRTPQQLQAQHGHAATPPLRQRPPHQRIARHVLKTRHSATDRVTVDGPGFTQCRCYTSGHPGQSCIDRSLTLRRCLVLTLLLNVCGMSPVEPVDPCVRLAVVGWPCAAPRGSLSTF